MVILTRDDLELIEEAKSIISLYKPELLPEFNRFSVESQYMIAVGFLQFINADKEERERLRIKWRL